MGCPLRFVLLLFFFPFLFLSDPKPLRARTRTRGLSSSEPNRWDFIFRAVRIRLLKGPENGDGAPTEPHSGHGRTGEGGGDFSGGPEPLRSLCLLALPSIHSSFHPSVSPSVRPSIRPSIRADARSIPQSLTHGALSLRPGPLRLSFRRRSPGGSQRPRPLSAAPGAGARLLLNEIRGSVDAARPRSRRRAPGLCPALAGAYLALLVLDVIRQLPEHFHGSAGEGPIPPARCCGARRSCAEPLCAERSEISL